MDQKIAAGIDPEQARREATLEFGGNEQIKEECRDVHRIATLETTLANLKSAFRFIRKSPTFSLAIILTIALAIGANSAVFSAVDAILLKPLPFPDANGLMLLHQYNPKRKTPESVTAPVRLEEWNRSNSTFHAITGYYTEDASETSGSMPEKLTIAWVAPRFLQVWGVAPEIGRDFRPEELHFGGPNAVLISNRLWERRFHADPGAVGKTLRMGKYSYPIVGIMPASFLFPDREVDVWSPVPIDAPYTHDRNSTWYTTIGRLKPGVTIEQARANLAAVQAQLGREFPKTDKDLTVEIQPLKETTVAGVRRSLLILLGSVSLLLLIACSNIAALLLARTTQREREISIRYSLGASRRSIVAQLLTESFALATIGAGIGLAVAAAASHAFRLLAKSLPRVEEISLDWRIVLYTLACAIGATLLFGFAPAIHASRRSLSTSLANNSRTQVSARLSGQWALVGVQVALAVTLLIGAGLLLRSFQELGRVSPGFDAAHVLTFHITGSYGETADMKKLNQRIQTTLEALRAVPGVKNAATSIFVPGASFKYPDELTIVDTPSLPDRKVVADMRFVSAGYFETVQIPMLAGHSCQNTNTETAVVNRSFVNTYLANLSPLGHHFNVSHDFYVHAPPEIVGISSDDREDSLNQAPVPTVYRCVEGGNPDPFYLVRTAGDPAAMASTIRRAIQKILPSRSVFDITPLEQRLYDSLAENRLRTLLLTLFALTAISLACVGIYGTLSYFVTVRNRETGLRIALGALPNQILKKFLVRGVGISVAGCIAGLLLAAALTRLLAGMLYGISRSDFLTYSGVAAIVLIVAASASLLPALRASHVDAMRVLREE
ncbi:MAG: ABC transporter permease [Acidobacteriaceae bacterium]|nr:ABC transporter permease [Acidobacteriaceae bacterium]